MVDEPPCLGQSRQHLCDPSLNVIQFNYKSVKNNWNSVIDTSSTNILYQALSCLVFRRRSGTSWSHIGTAPFGGARFPTGSFLGCFATAGFFSTDFAAAGLERTGGISSAGNTSVTSTQCQSLESVWSVTAISWHSSLQVRRFDTALPIFYSIMSSF